jgi:hypothetical protein
MDMLCKAIHLGADISFAYYCNEVRLSHGDGAALVRRPLVPAARATHLPRDVGICNEAPPPRGVDRKRCAVLTPHRNERMIPDDVLAGSIR